MSDLIDEGNLEGRQQKRNVLHLDMVKRLSYGLYSL